MVAGPGHHSRTRKGTSADGAFLTETTESVHPRDELTPFYFTTPEQFSLPPAAHRRFSPRRAAAGVYEVQFCNRAGEKRRGACSGAAAKVACASSGENNDSRA